MPDKLLNISEEVLKFLSKNRYYVFFADGTWRTCEEEQWRDEQLWKLKPVSTFWFHLDPTAIKAIEAVIERFND